MFPWPSRILAATAPIDLRLSFDRLAGIVREQLGADPKRDTLVVFHNRARTHIKCLWHDGSGYWIAYKRLDRGAYLRLSINFQSRLADDHVTRAVLDHRGQPDAFQDGKARAAVCRAGGWRAV